MSFALLLVAWLVGAWCGTLALLFMQSCAARRGVDGASQARVRFEVDGTTVLSMTVAELEALGGIDCAVDSSQL